MKPEQKDNKIKSEVFPNYVLIRMLNTNSETIGELKVNEKGYITFEGNFDESANRLADYVCELFKQRINKHETRTKSTGDI